MNELRLRIKLQGKAAKNAEEDNLDHLSLHEDEEDSGGLR